MNCPINLVNLEKVQGRGEKRKITVGLTLTFPKDKLLGSITLIYKVYLESSQDFMDSGATRNFL